MGLNPTQPSCRAIAGALSPYSIPFDRAPFPAVGTRGSLYLRWLPVGMPKLGQYAPILKAVVFLYPDVESASKGVSAGGTGFLISVPTKNFPGFVHVHAVTNKHVAVFNEDAPPSPVVRVNQTSGEAEAFDFDPSEWVFKAGGPDIAISPPLELKDKIHDCKYFGAEWFIAPEEETAHEIGPGDDVFMIGRFVDYDDVETNVPAARFGHISMMSASIEQSTGYKGRSIVLDMHSRSGFSGSPVIVYRTLGSEFLEIPKGNILTGAGHYIKLLGIHYAQFPEEWALKEKKPSAIKTQAIVKADSHYIEGLSGMTCVVPAAEILSLLNSPELEKMRDDRERRWTRVKPSGAPKPESAPQSSGENPKHQEDFNSSLSQHAKDP